MRKVYDDAIFYEAPSYLGGWSGFRGRNHGGLEAILITGLSSISLIVYAFAINSGTFEQLLVNGDVKQALLPIQEQLLHTPSYEWMLGGIERISAIAVQIGLSLLVLYAVKSRRPLFCCILFFYMHCLMYRRFYIREES
nr:YhfC family glutamic-type intramembrane protease [Bacillus subtilis]